MPVNASVRKPYGFELIVDLKECDVERFTKPSIDAFFKDLCFAIGMTPEDRHFWASEPDDYEIDPPHLHGISAVQFITTSTIVIHTLSKLAKAYVNVFSCQLFDPSVAASLTCQHFDGQMASHAFMERV